MHPPLPHRYSRDWRGRRGVGGAERERENGLSENLLVIAVRAQTWANIQLQWIS